MPEEFDIFRVYETNHPEALNLKPPERKSEKEVDFTPKGDLSWEAPAPSEPVKALPFLDEAVAAGIDHEISRICDINEMIGLGNFPGAEYLLGRKLTPEEISEKAVRDLLKPKAKMEQQIRDELKREELKAKIKMDMIQQGQLQAQPVPTAPPLPPAVAPARPAVPPVIAAAGGPPPPPPPPPGPPPPGQGVLAAPPIPPRPSKGSPIKAPPGLTLHPPILPPSPIVSRPASPTHSVTTVMSQDTQKLIDAMNKLPNPPKVVDFYNRLMALGVDDDDFDEITSETDQVFVDRLKALGAPPAKIQEIVPMQKAVHNAALQLLANPAAAGPNPQQVAAASAHTSMDFNYNDLGEQKVFDPTRANKDQPLVEELVLVREAMIRKYPGFEDKYFTGLMAAKPDKGDLLTALRLANAEIVQGPVAAQPVPVQSAVDFTYTQKDGSKKTFDPTLPDEDQPTVGKLLPIRNSMIKVHPEFAQTHLKGFTSKTPGPRADFIEALRNATTAIVKMPKKGKGIADEEKPGRPVRGTRREWVPFGTTYQIDSDALKHGKFAVTYAKTGKKPAWTNNAELSPALQACLQAYLAGQPMNTLPLNEEEQAWLKHVWHYAKIQREKAKPTKLVIRKPLSGQQTRERTLKLRLKTLIGEQDAGNDNPEVGREMVKVARELLFLGAIDAEQLAQVEQLAGN